ncbi:MAG: ammonium transporter, partial [Chloroflexota bacterium]
VWILLAGFLVFFMQAGFAMLEAGFIRQTGVVNSLTENFVDAGITGILFWAVGFTIAYGSSQGGFIGGMDFFMFSGISDAGATLDSTLYLNFFFQFAFAAAASTIATGGMAERTDFVGKIIYSAVVGAFIYPVVVHWIWGGEGAWLYDRGYNDFAGSAVVHLVGGILALVGALMIGPRKGVDPKNPPRPHNLALASIGTSILWFGWYGFNVGSTLDATNPGLMGLVATNTTLAAAAGGFMAILFGFFTKGGKWDLGLSLNGSLAGLVGITASCGFVAPWASVLIGLTAGIVMVLSVDAVANAGIDDAVGAFAVHGACGMLGVLSIGFFGVENLLWSSDFLPGASGLFYGGGFGLLWLQFYGMAAVVVWTTVTSVILFGALKAIGKLRIDDKAMDMGIDVYEHGASVWPDVLDIDGEKGSVAAAD